MPDTSRGTVISSGYWPLCPCYSSHSRLPFIGLLAGICVLYIRKCAPQSQGCTALCQGLLAAQAQASYSIALPLPAHCGSRLTHNGDGSVVGHKAKAVLEDSMAIEERDGTSSALKLVLKPPQPGTRRVLNLVIYVILPKGEYRHQICPRGRQERGCVEGQEGIGWSPSLLKGPSEQEL